MRIQLIAIAAIAALFSLVAAGAQAMPAAPLHGASQSGDVIKVANGCGRHYHWSRYRHHCVHN